MRKILCHPFALPSPFAGIIPNPAHAGHLVYLASYLSGLRATSIVEEPVYFDRDYLAECAAFYCMSARSYSNRCRRLHYFSTEVTPETLTALAAAEDDTVKRLHDAYLGFSVIRPITAQLGRTVLAWHPDSQQTPRNTTPSRKYTTHLLGQEFAVQGIAWQQQDSAVGACATIALWSTLHTSAFDASHAVPTTADITRFAHRTASLGSRVFPSDGLHLYHILEAIKEAGLAPAAITPDRKSPAGNRISREKFGANCAAMIRSGYPVVLAGKVIMNGRPEPHAICAVGFRETLAPAVPPGGPIQFHDTGVEYVYIHDDNIGPNVRFQVAEDHHGVLLTPSSPSGASATPANYGPFVPECMAAAMHEGIRTTANDLLTRGLSVGKKIHDFLNKAAGAVPGVAALLGLSISARFCTVASYLGHELGIALGHNPGLLGRVRQELVEGVEPLCLHLGVVRFGTAQARVLDLIYDTTDSQLRNQIYCAVFYDPLLEQALKAQPTFRSLDPVVRAY
jgi:hypothetical protein